MYLKSFESDSLQCRKAIVLRVYSLYSASEEITLKNIWALLIASSSFFFFFFFNLAISLDEFTPNLYQPRFQSF